METLQILLGSLQGKNHFHDNKRLFYILLTVVTFGIMVQRHICGGLVARGILKLRQCHQNVFIDTEFFTVTRLKIKKVK
jgi:hypothetical protein